MSDTNDSHLDTTISLRDMFAIGEEVMDVTDRWVQEKGHDPRLVLGAVEQTLFVLRIGLMKQTGVIPSGGGLDSIFAGLMGKD